MQTDDIDSLLKAAPVAGVRLLPYDDPFAKLDRTLLVRDETQRNLVFPAAGQSIGYIPGPILVDGEIVGSSAASAAQGDDPSLEQRPKRVRDAIEAEALAFPIASTADPSVTWA